MSRVAVVQMVSVNDVQMNLIDAAALIEQAVAQSAELILLPENFGFLGRYEAEKLPFAEAPGQGAMQAFLAEQASQHGIWLIGGSVPIQSDDPNKVFASCLVYGPDGGCHARYDKMHLFDVALPDSDEQYRESASHIAGGAIQQLDTGIGRLGLSICYDLRFPELYRGLSAQGTEIFTVPSAFTYRTGEAHWEVLLRARAVENLCYVLAANQGGEHPGGRKTWGGSMIVSPWGEVLASLEQGPGVAVADIDLEQLQTTRKHFPVLEHRKL
ncbi:MAG: carbon-nitrogen hydrolase family protein [Salinisphaeraceae bacterium]|nr:carbon-nitrogen hydrolase family protein [Salinisphaeraceae bacterium]